MEDGALVHDLTGHAKGLSDCAWTANSEYLATASDDKARSSLLQRLPELMAPLGNSAGERAGTAHSREAAVA